MSYVIANLPQYPKTGEHQTVMIIGVTPFPFRITKGEDTWYYYDENRNEVAIKPNLWYVYVSNEYLRNQGIRTKGFRKAESAVKYAMREYRKWLRLQLKKVKEFKIEQESL